MGRGIAVVNLDTAGGRHLGGGQSLCTINGNPIVVLDDRIEGHGDSPHNNARMVEGSSVFTINGKPVVLEGHRASCGHVSTGRPNFTVSG